MRAKTDGSSQINAFPTAITKKLLLFFLKILFFDDAAIFRIRRRANGRILKLIIIEYVRSN